MYPNASECVKTGRNGPENVEKSRQIAKKLPENSGKKKFNCFHKFLDENLFAESIRMYQNVSECVKTIPNRSENIENFAKTSKNLQKVFSQRSILRSVQPKIAKK